jgi:hypothetical protein
LPPPPQPPRRTSLQHSPIHATINLRTATATNWHRHMHHQRDLGAVRGTHRAQLILQLLDELLEARAVCRDQSSELRIVVQMLRVAVARDGAIRRSDRRPLALACVIRCCCCCYLRGAGTHEIEEEETTRGWVVGVGVWPSGRSAKQTASTKAPALTTSRTATALAHRCRARLECETVERLLYAVRLL